MNTRRDTTSATNSILTRFRRRIGHLPFALLAPLALALTVPIREADGQGVVSFNNRIPGGAGVGITLHIWGPSTTNPRLALVGLGSNDSPSGTTPFGSASDMALIGAGGSGGHYGYATTLAQLIGAVGADQPESALVPVGQTTTFRSGTTLGEVAVINDTLTAVPPYTTTIPVDTPAATFEIVAWDNISGLYSTWAQASVAWQQGLIFAGRSAPFTVTAIGGSTKVPTYLNNGQGSTNGMTSFNLYSLGLPVPVVATLPAAAITATSATLNGTVNPAGYPTAVWFQWGTNTTYGNLTAATGMGSGTNDLPLSVPLALLSPGSTYHFRLVATNSPYAVVYGGDQTFTTASSSVVTNCNEAALRLAMAGGGTVTFACDGTITLASTITNEVSLTLDGSGHQVTISGSNAVRVFTVNTNLSFTVINLTIADGFSEGGSAILNLGGTVNLTVVTFRSNTATPWLSNDYLNSQANGGAIFNRGGTVNASNCSFAWNTAQTPLAAGRPLEVPSGGAIRNEAGQMDLRSCTFVGNRASGGAGSWAVSDPAGDPGLGGAIHNSGTLTLDLCTLAGNSATGGAAAESQYGFAGWSGGEGSGGGIYNLGTLTVSRTTLSGNSATGGSGSAGSHGSEGTYADGHAGGTGGAANGTAICNLGSLWVAQSTFASNVGIGGVGGAGGSAADYIGDTGGNGGSGGGGGSALGGALFNSGAASLVNCTIALNTGSGGPGGAGGAGAQAKWAGWGGAGGYGGSGFGGVDGTCDLTNCTIAWNVGNGGSGGAGGAGGTGQYPGTPGAPGTSGTAYGGTVCSTLVNTLIVSNTPATNDSFADPKLGPLANNGGPTLTMALLPGSPAIDAADTSAAPATDQRGAPRPVGPAADIGAYEYGWPAVLRVSRSGGTGLDLLAFGNAGQSCRLLASSDLSNWTLIATNQIGTNGTVLFQDNCAPGNACRFYRLVMP